MLKYQSYSSKFLKGNEQFIYTNDTEVITMTTEVLFMRFNSTCQQIDNDNPESLYKYSCTKRDIMFGILTLGR